MGTGFVVASAEKLAPGITRFTVSAPRVAAHCRAGQFVIVRVHDHGERIPLTICDHDRETGTITLVVQAVGATTEQMSQLEEGNHLADVLGPLGLPTEIDRYGRVLVVGGGVGTAIALPVAKALADEGNAVHGIIGARDADHLILVDEMSAVCDEVTVMTDDGSAGLRGFVTEPVRDLVEGYEADFVFAAGPIVMMSAIAEITREYDVPTVASLNPIMVDGTGMCGGCRVKVGGETKFACVDGPEFDAHEVDFALLETRNRSYLEFERCQADELEQTHG
ncbi:MAG: sulfide/dihydroorotate dehydrogenase-like FAD/NAD-binding protein [Acidimicrobiia bacterium]|jgi:ferredoxin--NADP+ reductase